MRKFLVSTVAVAALATSSFAYDNFFNMQIGANNSINQTNARIKKTGNQFGNALLYPYYVAANGYKTTIRVINTEEKPVVAKAVFYDIDSNEVMDFNIYLSPNDEWEGVVYQENGVTYVMSTDDSVVADRVSGTFASKDKPMTVAFKTPTSGGYFEIIGLATVEPNAVGDVHSKPAIRSVYLQEAKTLRGITSSKLIFSNGTLTTDVLVPNINLDNTPNLSEVENDTLTGEIILSSDAIKASLVSQPIALDIYSDNENTGLLYIEGEKANIADVEITHTATGAGYDTKKVANDIYNITGYVKKAYITYNVNELDNTMVSLTIPMKKIAGAQLALDGSLNSSGCFTGIAQVYDKAEHVFGDNVYSPYSTPSFTVCHEVENISNLNELIKNIYTKNSKFASGYAVISNYNYNHLIPGIFTEMKAVEVGGQYSISWFMPPVK